MKPLLAHIFSPSRWNGEYPVHVQPKFDGIRALYQDGSFQSRDELPLSKTVTAHLVEPLKAMFPDPKIILDGELYVHGWALGRINGAITPVRQEPNEDTLQIQYWVFDRVSYQLPFAERFAEINHTIRALNHPLIKSATTVETSDPLWADDFYARMVGQGFEGIMYRIGDCPYTYPKDDRWSKFAVPRGRLKLLADKHNRTYHLLKRKDWQDDEFECIAVAEGQGKRSGMVGRLICQLLRPDGSPYYPRKTFGVGSGLSDAEATQYLEHPELVIGHKVKVKFRCYTADGVPFNPIVITVL